MKKIKSIGIFGNPKNELAVDAAKRAVKLLDKKKIPFQVAEEFPFVKKDLTSIEGFDCDLIIIFGGDGTLLHLLRHMSHKPTPVLGVHCGLVGSLMELNNINFEKNFLDVLEGKFAIEKRARLQAEVDGKKLQPSLNEIVLVSTKTITTVRYDLWIGGKFMGSDAGNGIIAATPTGSTAYALSAGGPVLMPDTKSFLLQPIDSLKNSRKYVVNENAEIKILRIIAAHPCEVVIDGQYHAQVKKEIKIKKSKTPAVFVRMLQPQAPQEKILELKMQNLNPGAKFIYKMLELRGGMTVRELSEETKLPSRTLNRTLNLLVKKQIIVKRKVGNARSYYTLNKRMVY